MRADEAMEMLASARTHRRRARTDRRAVWFPLVLFGCLTILGAPLYAEHLQFYGPTPSWADLYWLVAGTLGYLAVARFYRQREADIGIGSPIAPYVWVGVGLFLLAFGLLAPVVQLILPFAGVFALVRTPWLIPGFEAILAMGVGLLVLSWIQRSVPLAVFATGFSVLALLCGLYFFDNRFSFSAWYQSIVDVTCLGIVLIVSGLLFRAGERRAARDAR